MLGIAVDSAKNNENEPTYVFLYYTESVVDGNDNCPKDKFCNLGNDPLGNRLYRYELVNDKLVNPKLMLNLPAEPGPGHNGGAVTIGPDNNVYLAIGDVKIKWIQKVSSADGRGGILMVTQDGEVSGEGGKGILGNTYPLNLYYAYGIRNSFGIDFDPVTGKLWDTENGPKFIDEINLVEPGFNSGGEDNLLDFGGKAKYSPPEFTWVDTIGPTALKFLNSDKLGKQYQNDIFVGDVVHGNIYHFKLDKKRTGLLFLEESLSDKVADKDQENEGIIFGKGFGSISDLEVGPDGYLYIVSHGQGAIYRIVPSGGVNNSDIIPLQPIDPNTKNRLVINDIINNITQLVMNNNEKFPQKNYTKIIEQKFKGNNCLYSSFCDVLVNVIYEGNNIIFLEGSTKTLSTDTRELTFSDIFFQSIELLQQDRFEIKEFENIGDGKFLVILSR